MPESSRLPTRRFEAPCRICGAMLVTELTRVQADGGLVAIRGAHSSKRDGALCSGYASAIATWPVQQVRRRCARGHESRALAPEGWMPPEPLDPAIPRVCSLPACTARVDFRETIVSVWLRPPFTCQFCGEVSEGAWRRGEPLLRILCQRCRKEQGDPAPASFSVADVGPGLFRTRCERCASTWEEQFPTFRCRGCGAAAENIVWPPPAPKGAEEI
jgi:hypothetical protein